MLSALKRRVQAIRRVRSAKSRNVCPAMDERMRTPQSIFEAGVAAQIAGRTADAERHYRAVLAAEPAHAGALANLGALCRASGRPVEALELLRRAAETPSPSFDVLYNFGNALAAIGETEEAIGILRRAHDLEADNTRVALRLGLLLADAGNAREAAAILLGAVRRLKHDDPGLANGNALPRVAAFLFESGDRDASIPLFEAIAAKRPASAEAQFNLAVAQMRVSLHDAALAAYRRAYALDPANSDALTGIANSLVITGAADEAVSVYELALADPRHRRVAASAYLMALLYDGTRSGLAIAAAHRDIASELVDPAASPRRLASQRPAIQQEGTTPSSTLRVGYVTADLGAAHPVDQFLIPILERHASAGIAQFIYANTDRIIAEPLRSDRWTTRRDIARASDTEAAQLVAADGIDILIDLSGHTRGHRLSLFASRPAPITATFLGYPHTTGLASIDYLIADETVLPPGTEAEAAESILRLPDAFLCFAPPPTMPVPTGKHPEGPPVFGSLNHLPKLGPETQALWADVLKAVPGSRLLVKCAPFAERSVLERFRARMVSNGIAPDRLILEPPEPFADAMCAYERIDIALDPTPYNGGTTTAHALWMGVPVVTLCSDRFCGRMGASLSRAAGLPENVTITREGYVARAAELGADVARVRGARRSLHNLVRSSRLCDVDRYSAALIALFERMAGAR
ncbi:MAG: tetratricopeptide repeat protein [Hyphomicrobium sp.]|nr:tetratricopeptide repeat protein [Hyphomicrobium sp.]